MTALRIITWNANGLLERRKEFEVFLRHKNIDVALISESHFNDRTFFHIHGYTTYYTSHRKCRADVHYKPHAGTAIIVKNNVKHYVNKEICEDYIQITSIIVYLNNTELTLAAAYCPPRHSMKQKRFSEVFKQLSNRFILGGDYNAKHTTWGSRLITTKGRELLKAIKAELCEFHTSRNPTYWPTDLGKITDLIDFYITRRLAVNYTELKLRTIGSLLPTMFQCFLHSVTR